MNLRRATQAAIAGLCCLFLLRTLGTVLPEMFRSLAAARLSVLVHLLASLAMLAFFLLFSRELGAGRDGLRQATMLAALGAAVGVLAPLQAALRVFSPGATTPLARSSLIEPLAPLVATLTTLAFLAVFRAELSTSERRRLQLPATTALAGYAVFALLNLVVVGLYLTSGQLRWLTQMSREIALGVFPVAAAAFAAILYFYLSLLRHFPLEPAPGE